MKTAKPAIKDPVCGMTVDESAPHYAERDGKTSYFCSDKCRKQFLSAPADAGPDKKAGGCCS